MTFYPGALVRLTCTAKNVSDALVDPSTLTFKVADPHGEVTTYVYDTDEEIVRSSLGVFYVDVSVTRAGIYSYRFSSTGPQASIEGEIEVLKTAF